MDKIIRVWHGGLGDNIMLTTLPEMFTRQGHDVYISNETPFWGEEIKDLVWGRNPYVLGFKDAAGNCGEIPGFEYKNTEDNFIKNWEVVNGLKPKNDFPIIYYEPQKVKKGYGLINISSKSLADQYNVTKVITEVMLIMENYGIPFLQITGKYVKNNIVIPNVEHVEERDMFHQLDLIANCDVFISMSSGPHMMAGAMRHSWDGDQYCFIPEKSWDTLTSRKLFILPKVNYIKI